MNKPIAVGVGLLLLVLLLLFSTTFTVKFNEVAVKATFGETDDDSVITEPGLHYRLPVFIDKVTKLDTRLQLVESPLEEITTSDGMQIVVRAYLLWKVDKASDRGPLDFFLAYQSVESATGSLRGQFRTAFTGALSKYTFADLIGSGSRLAVVESEIRDDLVASLTGKGVDPVAVGISQLVLPPKTSSAVLSRMQETRNVEAEGERGTGQSEASSIRSEGNTTSDKIRSFASRRAEEIRAEGEQEAAKYLEEMGEDESLAIFLVWLDTLERTMTRNATVVLPARGFPPFHLLDPEEVVFDGSIPMPSEAPTIRTAEVVPPAAPATPGEGQ